MATRRAYCCGLCRQTGHNRRTCPTAHVSVPPSVAAPVTAFESDSCPICMETLTATGRCTTPCGHQFCLGCFIKAYRVKPNCPICRDEMVTLRDVSLPVQAPDPIPLSRTFSIGIGNTGTVSADVYWIRHSPTLDRLVPLLLHQNIAPLSRRIIQIGSIGDRFWLDFRRSHIVSMADVRANPEFIFSAAPNTTYACSQNSRVIEIRG